MWNDPRTPDYNEKMAEAERVTKARMSEAEYGESQSINAVSSVENLHGDISYLENVLSMLNERLAPVVNRNVPRPAKGDDPNMASDRPLYADLTGRVLDARERVRVIIGEVENLMRTLELP